MNQSIMVGAFFSLFSQAILVVNVASECGFTDQHYKELVELQNTLPSKDFVILGFPSNQFGQQEPKRNSAIQRFVRNTYGVKFPMFSKIKVIGDMKHPIYKFLEDQSGHTPVWNFNKYLLNRQGKFVKYWDQSVSPSQCLPKIRELISHAFDSRYETFRVDGEL